MSARHSFSAGKTTPGEHAVTEPSDRNSQERSTPELNRKRQERSTPEPDPGASRSAGGAGKDVGQDAGKTPGRARDAASRQQTHQDQGLQSGSPELDEDATRRTDTPAVPTVPPGPK